MNGRFILTQGSETVKQDLTVPSGSSDIRLVAETSENRPVKRRGFRKLAKNLTTNISSARPARRIKLNRSIFNTEYKAKPTIHAKTLNEIKNAKEDSKSPVKPSTEVSVNILNSVVGNTTITSPMPASAVDLSERSVAVNASPVRPAHASTTSDTRTVIKRENNRLLLLPSIELRRISHDEFKRHFTNQNKPLSHSGINGVIGQTLPKEGARRQTEAYTLFTQPSQGTPVKKRKISPMHLSNFNTSKKRKVSPIRSPDSEALKADPALPSPPQPPSPLDSPPSPALSLGAQSDDDFDNEAKTAIANSRVIIMSKLTNTETTSCKKQNMHLGKKHVKTPSRKQHVKKVQTNTQCDVHSRLGPPHNTQTTIALQKNATSDSFVDDSLDIMSIIADDDELFHEDKPNGPLKRTVSQDSIFSMTEETSNRGNLRSLVKKTQANRKHSVGDLITSKQPTSKSFRIPRRNSEQDNETRKNNNSFPKRTTGESSVKCQAESDRSNSVRKGSDPPGNIFFCGSHCPPKPTRVVSKERQPFINGFSVQEKLRSIHRNLGAKNIQEAWLVLKELEDSKSVIDVRIVEETLKVCESVSIKAPTPVVAEIAVGVFQMLKRRQAMKPVSYILTVLTLCRCGKFQEAFDKILEMVEARIFPPQEILVHFFNDLLKCFRTNLKWIFELLPYIKRFNFSNPTHIFNNCLSSLVSAPADVLREIIPSQWDTLISMLGVPPNVQGAMQVQNIMNKHCIPMSDQSITKLLNLYRDTKCTKQLLDLFHLKCTNEMFDIGTIFADQSLNLRDVEAHIRDLVKNGSLPRKEVLHHFIEKASSMKDFGLVYSLFLKCESSSVSLSVTTLKKMVDVLENWDENMTASVEVYAALRQAKMSVMKEPRSTPPLNLPQKREANKFQFGRCFPFMKTGWCNYGDRCKYSHVVDERRQFFKLSSDTSSPQSVGECRKSDGSESKQQLNAKTQASTSVNTTMVNGHGTHPFPSFQHPSFVVPMFSPIQNHVPPPLRVPQPFSCRPAMSTRPPFLNRFQPRSVNPTPRFAVSQPPLNKPMPLMFPRAATPDKVKLNRSFSWEPTNNSVPQSPLPRFQQPNPSSDNNNNNVVYEAQQRVDRAVTSKDWPEVYLSFVEWKQANNRTVQASDLRIFRNVFLNDVSVVGSNFSEFVDFIHKEKGSVKSSNSGSGNNSLFDHYDIEFLGSLAVSLMEKCLVTKKFDRGYEILHTVHAHNISYFDCGKNFGAYTRDIPPSAVAIIAVKLCTGVSQDDGLLGALEVLRASNYAMPEDNITPENMEYRIKVLQHVFTQLFDQGNISEAYEILQHLKASHNVMVPLYVKVLNYYASVEDFDQSFDVLAEMNENGFDLNIPACQLLYEKFLKLCLTNRQDDEARTTLEEMESRGIMLNGDVWQGILNQEPSITNDILTNMLFQRCLNVDVYPATFSKDTPWLCQLGCGYSQVEVKLLIVRHLKQLRQYLVQNKHSNLSLSTLKDFQIALFPRVSESHGNPKLNEGIQTAINKNGLIVTKVLEEDLNPPLIISDHSKEQFHSKFIVDSLSLYRWFNANQDDIAGNGDDGDDASSNGSMESCVSYMTRMTEFD